MDLQQRRASKKATLTAEPAAGQLFAWLQRHLSSADSHMRNADAAPALTLPAAKPDTWQPAAWQLTCCAAFCR